MHFRAYTCAVIWSAAAIKDRREARGWTQQQLADALGASRRAIIGWESGTSEPQGRFAKQLERVLGVASDDDTTEQGPLLRDADFAETVNHLITLYQRAQRDSIQSPPLPLTVDPNLLSPDHAGEHDVTVGPVEDEPATAASGKCNHPNG